MTTNNRAAAAKFRLDVSKWMNKQRDNADQVVSDVMHSILSEVDSRTPVDTGHLRANWQYGSDAPPAGEIDGKGEPAAYAQMEGGLKAGHKHYLVNNLVYAPVVEYGLYPNPPKHGTGKTIGGFSTQAPAGMLRVSALEFVTEAKKALAKIK